MRAQISWMFFHHPYGLDGILEVIRVIKKPLTNTKKNTNIFYIPSMAVLVMLEDTLKTPSLVKAKSKPMVGKKPLYKMMFLILQKLAIGVKTILLTYLIGIYVLVKMTLLLLETHSGRSRILEHHYDLKMQYPILTKRAW